MKKNQNK